MIELAQAKDMEAITLTCPGCYSTRRDLRNRIFPVGNAIGYICVHDWHQGPSYDPSVLTLTESDKALLHELAVSA